VSFTLVVPLPVNWAVQRMDKSAQRLAAASQKRIVPRVTGVPLIETFAVKVSGVPATTELSFGVTVNVVVVTDGSVFDDCEKAQPLNAPAKRAT